MNIKSIILSLKKYLLFFSLSILLFSCGSRKEIVYFQNVDSDGISKSILNYDAIIRPDDLLEISVSALDQDAARPFNLNDEQNYLVDANGNIDFPVLGKLKLAGLNKIQSKEMIKDMLKDYIKDPIVNIRTMNFKITILGEVTRPGSYNIPNERITLIEALGLAGDMTIKGKRENVLVIREIDGERISTRIDMTSSDLFHSSVYFLMQNDVIYVEPNNSQVKSSTIGPSTTEALRIVSTLVTVAALIVSITR